MRFGNDWNRLQQVADYRMARKTLRTGAIGSIIMGAIALGIGVMPPLTWMPVAIGLTLLGTGLWNMLRPSPAGIVIDGLTLILVGATNILGSLGGGGTTLWVKLGIFQLYWGGVGIMRFKEFRNALGFHPQDTELKALDDLIQTVEKAKVKEAQDTIEFTTTGFHAKVWRGRLDDQGALLIQMGQRAEGVAKLRYRLGQEPRDVNARVNLAIALIEDGRPGEAIAELEHALRVKPDSVPALTSLGRALLAEGRAQPAQAVFERALRIDATDPVAHLGLARAHLARGDRAAAREQIPVLDRLDPRLARILEQEIR